MQDGKLVGVLQTRGGPVEFQRDRFWGRWGSLRQNGWERAGKANSIPPGSYGGNLDIRYLVEGTTLYLPVQVAGGGVVCVGPALCAGDGEVAFDGGRGFAAGHYAFDDTASRRERISSKSVVTEPFAETPEYWIPIVWMRI